MYANFAKLMNLDRIQNVVNDGFSPTRGTSADLSKKLQNKLHLNVIYVAERSGITNLNEACSLKKTIFVESEPLELSSLEY